MKPAKCKTENCVNYNIFLYNDNWWRIHEQKSGITIAKLASILNLSATNVPTVLNLVKIGRKCSRLPAQRPSIEYSLLLIFLCSLFPFAPTPSSEARRKRVIEEARKQNKKTTRRKRKNSSVFAFCMQYAHNSVLRILREPKPHLNTIAPTEIRIICISMFCFALFVVGKTLDT